jgi:hypothetical protein
VVLSIDGIEVVTASEATCGFEMPQTPLNVQLGCNLDGGLAESQRLRVDTILVTVEEE